MKEPLKIIMFHNEPLKILLVRFSPVATVAAKAFKILRKSGGAMQWAQMRIFRVAQWLYTY